MFPKDSRWAATAGLTLALGISFFHLSSATPAAADETPTGLTATQSVLGTTGGQVTGGRWTVDVPAGAFPGLGTITIRTASANATICDLTILPASLNRFAAPVRLTAQFPPGTDVTRYVIRRFDPTSNRWEVVPGSRVDPTRARVSAPLEHFSIYEVVEVLLGKSGW